MSAILFEAHLRAHLDALPKIDGFVIGGSFTPCPMSSMKS